MEIIRIKNVSKSYGKIKAVDDASIVIYKKELFGLLGPNGAGKSTLISLITTLLKPDNGSIMINGQDITKKRKEVKKNIGLVPQEIALYPSLSATENLTFWGRMYGLSGSILKERIDETLGMAGLKDRAKDRIETYSGGMKRRINIAAAILHKPDILIMDEPTVGIDPQSRNHILETVQKLNDEGLTVVYTSHYMEEVEYLCKRIAIMDYGKIIAYGTKEELGQRINNSETINIKAYNINTILKGKIEGLEGIIKAVINDNKISIITENAETVLADVITTFEKEKVKIQSINIEEPNLENVFLHLTGRALRD